MRLEDLHGFLTEWTQESDALQPEATKYLKGHFLGETLLAWDVSRPAPYFGFEIPDFFPVIIGTFGLTRRLVTSPACLDWCAKHAQDLASWWPTDQDSMPSQPVESIIYWS